jgi:hypothetical protein
LPARTSRPSWLRIRFSARTLAMSSALIPPQT